jgi:hypothetical protein
MELNIYISGNFGPVDRDKRFVDPLNADVEQI